MAKDLRRIRWRRSCLIIVGKESPLSVLDFSWFYWIVCAKIFSRFCRCNWSSLSTASATQLPCSLSSNLYNQMGRHTFICLVPPSVEKIELNITFSIYNSTLLLYMTIFVQENKVLCLQRLSLLFFIEELHNKNSLLFKGDHRGVPHSHFTFLVT